MGRLCADHLDLINRLTRCGGGIHWSNSGYDVKGFCSRSEKDVVGFRAFIAKKLINGCWL